MATVDFQARPLSGQAPQIIAAEGRTIQEVVATLAVPAEYEELLLVTNHGAIIRDWSYVPQIGDHIVVSVIPAGGGGGGKGILGMLAAIAVIVAAAWAAPFIGAAMGGFFATAAGTTAITAGLGMIGMMAISALIPPPKMNRPAGGIAGGEQESQAYSLTGSSNQVRLYSPVPVLYGVTKFYPPLFASPRVESMGKKSDIAVGYDFGLGDVQFGPVQIGDQDYGQLGASLVIHHNTKTPELKHFLNKAGTDNLAFALDANTITATTRTNATRAILDITFPRGLSRYDDHGNLATQAAGIFTFRYREKGTSTWITVTPGQAGSTNRQNIWVGPCDKFTGVVPQNLLYVHNGGGLGTAQAGDNIDIAGHGTYKVISLRDAPGVSGPAAPYVEYTLDRNLPPDAAFPGIVQCTIWRETTQGAVAANVYDVATGDTVTWSSEGGGIKFHGSTAQPNVANVGFTFPHAGTWEIEVTRQDAVATSTREYNAATLSAVKSFSPGSPLRLQYRHTVMELWAQASDRLTGVVQNLSAICHRLLRNITATGWVDGLIETSNPALIALDILTHEANPSALKDAQIDFASFRHLADICDQDVTTVVNGVSSVHKRFTWNGVIDQGGTVQELVSRVLSNARAQLVIKQSGKFGVLVDEERTTPRQLLTPQNSWGFAASRSFPIFPHAIRVSYVEPLLNWARDEIMVYADGYDANNATIFENLELVGVTNYAEAWRAGRYYMAQGRMRTETFEVTMDVENLTVIRGDIVAVAHDVPNVGGQAARVKSVAGAVLTLDMPLTAPGSAGYVVRLADGTIKSGSVTAASTANATITLAAADPAIAPDDLIVVGELTRVTRNYIVLSVDAGADLTATLKLTPYVAGVYTADQGALPTWDPGFGADMTAPNVNGITADYSISHTDRRPYGVVNLAWGLKGNPNLVKEYVITLKRPDGVEEVVGTTEGTSHTWSFDILGNPAYLGALGFTVQPIDVFGARGNPMTATVTAYTDATPPAQVTGFAVNITGSSQVDIFWHHSQAADIAYYELRYSPDLVGASYDLASHLARVDWQTNRVTVGARTGTYFIRVVDTSGNASAPQSLRASLEKLPDLNLVRTIEDAPAWSGNMFQAVKGTVPGVATNAPMLAGGPGNAAHLGYYEVSTVYDAGQIEELRLISAIKARGLRNVGGAWVPIVTGSTGQDASSGDYSYWLEVSTSDRVTVMADWLPLSSAAATPIASAGTGWQPWRRVESVDVTGRLFRFRIAMVSSDPDVNMILVSGRIDIDVMERAISIRDVAITNAAAGVRVDFIPPFRSVPALAINIDGNAAATQYEVVSKTASSATIRLIDMVTKLPVTGQIDVSAIGEGRIRTQPI